MHAITNAANWQATNHGFDRQSSAWHHSLDFCGQMTPWAVIQMMPIIIQASMDMGSALVTTAGLSFIGLGAQAPTPEWGAMVGVGRRYLLSAWWISTFPGLAIFVTILGLNLLGDTLQDILWSRHE